MFPEFKNNPSQTPTIFWDAAGTVENIADAVSDGTSLSAPAELEVVAAYNSDGEAVNVSEFSFTFTATDGTNGINAKAGYVNVVWSNAAHETKFPVRMEFKAPVPAAKNYADEMESELSPVAGTPSPTVKPTVSTFDASDPTNVPSDLSPKATKRWNS